MTAKERRVAATERAILRMLGLTPSTALWPEIRRFARWHLRMGGRVPGECKTCSHDWNDDARHCITFRNMYGSNWRPKRGTPSAARAGVHRRAAS